MVKLGEVFELLKKINFMITLHGVTAEWDLKYKKNVSEMGELLMEHFDLKKIEEVDNLSPDIELCKTTTYYFNIVKEMYDKDMANRSQN